MFQYALDKTFIEESLGCLLLAVWMPLTRHESALADSVSCAAARIRLDAPVSE